MSEQPLPTLPMWRVEHIEPSPEMLALRANGPIHRVRFPSGHEGWWVTGYDEAKAVLSDAAFRPAGMPPAAFTPDSVVLGSPGWLVSHEGGEHARLRAIVAQFAAYQNVLSPSGLGWLVVPRKARRERNAI